MGRERVSSSRPRLTAEDYLPGIRMARGASPRPYCSTGYVLPSIAGQLMKPINVAGLGVQQFITMASGSSTPGPFKPTNRNQLLENRDL